MYNWTVFAQQRKPLVKLIDCLFVYFFLILYKKTAKLCFLKTVLWFILNVSRSLKACADSILIITSLILSKKLRRKRARNTAL